MDKREREREREPSWTVSNMFPSERCVYAASNIMRPSSLRTRTVVSHTNESRSLLLFFRIWLPFVLGRDGAVKKKKEMRGLPAFNPTLWADKSCWLTCQLVEIWTLRQQYNMRKWPYIFDDLMLRVNIERLPALNLPQLTFNGAQFNLFISVDLFTSRYLT